MFSLDRKLFTTLLFPCFVLAVQLLVKWANNFDITYVGVSLSATAMGQMFPYVIDEHLMLSKIYTVKSNLKTQKKGFVTKYEIELSRSVEKIGALKNLTTLLFAIVLMLFIFTVVLAFGEKGQELHNYLGVISVILSSWYILKA